MFVNEREIRKGAEFAFDLCIVGGGVAGITIAKELIGTSLDVCLVESGGLQFSESIQQLAGGEVTGVDANYPLRTRLRMFGGASNHWGGYCRPLDAYDMARKDWISDSVSWPYERDTLIPYYRRAAPYVDIRPFFESGPDAIAFHDEKCNLLRAPFHFSQPRPTRFGSKYLAEMAQAKNIHVFLNASANEFRLAGNQQAASHVRLVSTGGVNFRIRAKRFILATGGLENARQLLNSNREIATGIGNEHDLVGRYFMSHSPNYNQTCILLSGSQSDRLVHSLFSPVTSYLSLNETVKREHRLLNLGLSLKPFRSLDKQQRLDKLAGLKSGFDRVYGEDGSHALFRLVTVAEHSPNRDSRVSLGNGVDGIGMKTLKLDFRTSDIDRQSIHDSLQLTIRELGRLGLGRLHLEHEKPGDLSFAPDAHHMGTTRMHNDPKLGVVNEHCKVHGQDNLYVAGSSVFPSAGFANPTLTIVALAIKLADHIKALSR